MPKTLTALTISKYGTDFDHVSGKLLASDAAVEAAAALSAAGAVERGRDAVVVVGLVLLVEVERGAHKEAGVR